MRKRMERIGAAVMSLIMAGSLWGTSMPMMAYGDVIPGMYAENGDEYAVYTESDAEKVEKKATGANADEGKKTAEIANYSTTVGDLPGDTSGVYKDSVILYKNIKYSYKESGTRELRIETNGNTFAGLYTVSDNRESPVDDRSYQYADSRLTFGPDYLNTLSVGTHDYIIAMYPQGNQGLKPLEYAFCIEVSKAKLEVEYAAASDKTYDGSSAVDVTEVWMKSESPKAWTAQEIAVDTVGLKGTLDSADAGTYTKITLPELTLTGSEAGNYELIQPTGPVQLRYSGVTITKKAAAVIKPLDKSYVYLKETEESIDLAKLLPADCGEITYGDPVHGDSSTGEKKFGYYSREPEITGNMLIYRTAKTDPEQLKGDTSGVLRITAHTTNYKDMEIRINLQLCDQTNVSLKQGTEVRLKNNVLKYGEPLSKLEFENTSVFIDEEGNAVEGTLGWTDENWKPDIGTTRARWEFKPADEKYRSVYGEVEIAVELGEITVTGAAAEDRIYDAASDKVAISAVALSGVRDNDDVTVDITGLQGTLSSNKAGSYGEVVLPELKLTGADAKFYKLVQPVGAVALSNKVTIRKADGKIAADIKRVDQDLHNNADSIDLAELLPKDCGSVIYAAPVVTGNVTYSAGPEVKNGILTYTVRRGSADSEGMISVNVTTENYEDFMITVHVHVPGRIQTGTGDSSDDDSYTDDSSSKNSIPKKPESNADSAENGTWKKDARGWWYQYPDSSYAKGWRGTNAAGENYQQISWKVINGKWWSFDAEGYLAKGWVWDVNGAAWYYIDENEGMKTGWFREHEDSPWYYLDPKTGAMLKDTHVDGYYVDKTGMWDGK